MSMTREQELRAELLKRELANRQMSQEKQSSQQSDLGTLGNVAQFVNNNFNRPIEENIAKPGIEAMAGFGQGLANIPSGVANLAGWALNKLPGFNIPKVPSFDVVPHTMPAEIGKVASFFGGPGLVNEISKLPQLANVGKNAMSIPLIAKGVEHATNILNKSPMVSKIAGSAALGGVYSPDNPLLGLAVGASLPVGEKVVRATVPTVKNALSSVTPKEVATTVQTSHDKLHNYGVDLFKHVDKEVKKRGIETVPIDESLIDSLVEYLPNTKAVESLIKQAKSGNYSSLRDLQAELWTRGTKKLSSPLDSERMLGEELMEIRDGINEGISRHLKDSGHPELADLLNRGRESWAQLKDIYYTDPTIAKLVHEKTRKVPKNIITKLSEDSVPLQKVRESNPLINKKLQEYEKKQNALSKLKWVGTGGAGLGILGGLANLPSAYHKIKEQNVF